VNINTPSLRRRARRPPLPILYSRRHGLARLDLADEVAQLAGWIPLELAHKLETDADAGAEMTAEVLLQEGLDPRREERARDDLDPKPIQGRLDDAELIHPARFGVH